jgi:DnaK suppressor protein
MTTNAGLSQTQLDELRGKLQAQRAQLGRQIAERRRGLATATASRPDEADWASDSVDQGLMARLVDRDVKLLREIDRALSRMDAGTYGICEVTGEPIELPRLLARPWARLSLGAKEGREREEASHQKSQDPGPGPGGSTASEEVA